MRGPLGLVMRLLLRLLGWVALALLALAASAAFHLQLPMARRVASGSLSQFVSGEIRGDLLIGRFERLALDEVIARDVTLFDGEGRTVIVADRVRLVPDGSALLQGRLRFSSAKLTRGKVRLYDAGDGLPSFLTSFDAPLQGPPSSDPLHVVVDGIELSQVELRGELLGLYGIVADVDSARGQLDIASDVHVRIDEARGRIREPFGFVADVDSLTGTISTVPDEGVDLRARVHRERERATARIRFAEPVGRPGADSVFRLDVQGQDLTTATLNAIGLDFVPELAVHVSGELVLQGPFSGLALEGHLTSEAGAVHLIGLISETDGATVTLSTEKLQISRLRVNAPEITAAGTLRIEVPPDGGDPRLALVVEPVIYDTWAVPAFELNGVLKEDSVRIDSAAGRSRGVRIDMRGEVGFTGALDLRVKASFQDIGTDANLKRLIPNARGRLSADVTVQSPDLSARFLRFSGKVAVRDLRYGPLAATALTVEGSGRGDPQRPALKLALRGESVVVGDYPLGDPRLTLSGGPRLYQAEGQFVSAGRRTFNASARIVAERDRFVADADPIEFSVGEGSWRGAMQQLVFVPGESVTVQLLRLASRSQRLEAKGTVSFQGADRISARLQDFDLAAVNALLGGTFFLQQGRADAQLELGGDIERSPELQLHGALRNGAVEGLEGVNALYVIDYRTGRLEVDGEIDLGERGVLNLSGTGSIDPRLVQDPAEALRRGSYDLALASEGLSLAVWKPAADAGIRCKLSGELSVRGTLQDPEFRGTVIADPLHLPGWDPLRIRAEGGFASSQLQAVVSAGDDKGAIIVANGKVDLDWQALLADPNLLRTTLMRGPWQIAGDTVQRRLDELPRPLKEHVPYPVALGTKFALRKQAGETSGEVEFNGQVAALARDSICGQNLRMRVGGLATLTNNATHVAVTAYADDKEVADADVTVDTPVDRWVERGAIDRLQRFTSSVRVQVDALQRLPYLCEYGNGSLRGELELDGGVGTEPILITHFDATLYPRVMQKDRRHVVRVRSCEGDPIKAHFELNADATDMKLSGGTSGCHGGATELEAFVPVSWRELLVLPTPAGDRELRGRVRFDSAQLKPLLDRIPGVKNSDVLARGEVQLSGKLNALRTTGSISLAEGRMYLVPTGQELTDIEGQLTFRGDWAKLEYLRAKQGDGKIEASGGLGFKGPWPTRFKLALHTEELPIKREGLELGWITTSAAIDADIQRDRTRAEIKVHGLTLRLPDATNRSLQALEPHPEVTIVTEIPEPTPAPYPIELMIDGKRRLTIRRNDFEAAVRAELAVAYRDPALSVGGYIEFIGGSFEVFGKRFDIASGALRFDGDKELNPNVYLIATQKPEQAGLSPVTVSVTGTLAEPDITFSSDECPGENAAITYLVSGRCTADDFEIAQESSDARNAVAAGLLSGVLTLGAQSQIADLLPRAAVESVGDGGVRVAAGISSEQIVPKFMRPLVRRVYIQGGVTSGDTTVPQAPDQPQSGRNPLDFLIELYFPHSIVGAGRFSDETWGVDVTWEP